jgi:hypothetical protein
MKGCCDETVTANPGRRRIVLHGSRTSPGTQLLRVWSPLPRLGISSRAATCGAGDRDAPGRGCSGASAANGLSILQRQPSLRLPLSLSRSKSGCRHRLVGEKLCDGITEFTAKASTLAYPAQRLALAGLPDNFRGGFQAPSTPTVLSPLTHFPI